MMGKITADVVNGGTVNGYMNMREINMSEI